MNTAGTKESMSARRSHGNEVIFRLHFLTVFLNSPQKRYNTCMSKKETVQIEIRTIPLDVETEGLGVVELTDLAGQVEEYMAHTDEVDTLKQALLAAMHFAVQTYIQAQNEGGRRNEEISRVSDLVVKLKSALETPQK